VTQLQKIVDRRPKEAVSGRSGGVEGNARLTATTGVLLIVLLAVEGVTILFIRPLISMHVFVGLMLVPPVALKLGSTGGTSSATRPQPLRPAAPAARRASAREHGLAIRPLPDRERALPAEGAT
jgi:hypothetical protein